MAEKISVLKAIRLNCLQCSGGSSNEVKLCAIPSCPLYPFRFGKNPYREKRNLTPEQKEATAERLKNGREKAKGVSNE